MWSPFTSRTSRISPLYKRPLHRTVATRQAAVSQQSARAGMDDHQTANTPVAMLFAVMLWRFGVSSDPTPLAKAVRDWVVTNRQMSLLSGLYGWQAELMQARLKENLLRARLLLGTMRPVYKGSETVTQRCNAFICNNDWYVSLCQNETTGSECVLCENHCRQLVSWCLTHQTKVTETTTNVDASNVTTSDERPGRRTRPNV